MQFDTDCTNLDQRVSFNGKFGSILRVHIEFH